jgi:hypothetical protein
MVTIVTRAGKGAPLTNNELDANFVNLNNVVSGINGELPLDVSAGGTFVLTAAQA